MLCVPLLREWAREGHVVSGKRFTMTDVEEAITISRVFFRRLKALRLARYQRALWRCRQLARLSSRVQGANPSTILFH